MDLLQRVSFENRIFRHCIFWLAWVLGFTFIKSFGASWQVYAAWLFYYIITLPIFLIHTYLIVYWAARKFFTGPRIIIFVVLFILFLALFSFLELLVTNEIISRFFPETFSDRDLYLDPVHILISGIGNLYILIVFIAAKMIREWFVADMNKQHMTERSLYLKRADINAGIQPGMLLYSINEIERMLQDDPKNVPGALAMLSELLNGVMQAQKNLSHRVDEELQNVKKLVKLYALLFRFPMPRIKIEGENLYLIALTPFVVFSPIEIVLRNFKAFPEDSMQISIYNKGEVRISWESELFLNHFMKTDIIKKELEDLFPQQFQMEIKLSKRQCMLLISDKKPEGNSVNFGRDEVINNFAAANV